LDSIAGFKSHDSLQFRFLTEQPENTVDGFCIVTALSQLADLTKFQRISNPTKHRNMKSESRMDAWAMSSVSNHKLLESVHHNHWCTMDDGCCKELFLVEWAW